MSGITAVNSERSYAKRILQESMDRIIDVLGEIKDANLFFLKQLNLRHDLYTFSLICYIALRRLCSKSLQTTLCRFSCFI